MAVVMSLSVSPDSGRGWRCRDTRPDALWPHVDRTVAITDHDWYEFLLAQSGVVARIVTGPHDAHRQDPHRPMRYDTGRPRAVIRFRISQPRTASLPCPAGLRARRLSPMMDV